MFEFIVISFRNDRALALVGVVLTESKVLIPRPQTLNPTKVLIPKL